MPCARALAAHNAVVASDDDRTVVRDEGVRNVSQPAKRFVLFGNERLAAGFALVITSTSGGGSSSQAIRRAGPPPRGTANTAAVCKAASTKPSKARRDTRKQLIAAIGLALEHDRSLSRLKQPALAVAQSREIARCGRARDHYR